MTRSKKFRPWFSRLGILLVAGLLVFAGVGCDDSDSSFTPSAPETQVGVFADSPVHGMQYRTATQEGTTGRGGEFSYLEGEMVTFFIGNIVLGTCQAEPVVTPVDLVEGAVDETHPTVINIVRFLITLDENEDLDDGIGITDEMIVAAADLSLTFNMTVAAFESDHAVQVVVSRLTSFRGNRRPRGLLRAITAQLHLRRTLANLTIYVDNDEDGLSEWEGDCDDEDAETQGGCPPGPVDSATLENGYVVDFMGVDYNDNGTSTWNYTVKETDDAQDLSNWVLELPDCVLEGDILYTPAAGAEIVNPDPNAGFAGVKWETNEDFTEGTFSITVAGHLDKTTVQVAAKGPDVAMGEIDGPFCSEVTPADGDSDGYTADQGDADDTDPEVYPGAPEICGDGIDQDLDGADAVCVEEGVFLLGSQGVEGLEYQTYSVQGAASISGVTDENGRFEYLPGEEVAFFIGDIELGRVEAQSVITPIMLVSGGTVETPAVVHIARFLMTLDDDDDMGNGVSIAAAVHNAAAGASIDFTLENPFSSLLALIQDLTSARDSGGVRGLVIIIRVKESLEETEEAENELTADVDEDGFSAAVDCNDEDPEINPDAEEVCDDDIDHNCDGNAGCVEVPETVVLNNGFGIAFNGVEYNNNGSSTWHYTVEELQGAQDLSNWVLELPDCVEDDDLPHLDIIESNQAHFEAVHPDPNALLFGVKWEVGAGFHQGDFSVTVAGHWSVGAVAVAAKGPDVEIGQIAGPACEMFEVVDADADGWPADVDCEDDNPDVHPMAEEILGNDIDENCDGEAPAEDFLALDGNWKTPVDFDGPFIRFTVKGDEVKTLLLKVEDDCVGSDVVTAGNARLEIEENEFYYAVGGFELVGAFDNENQASGTYYALNACGDELTGEWAAERVSSDGDDVDDDGDGFSEDEGDADDDNADVNLDAEEVCGNDIDEDGDGVVAVCPDETAVEGYFIYGGGVAGLGYYTETPDGVMVLEGVTGEDGLFYFHEGETVTFFIGNLTFGPVAPVLNEAGEFMVTPVDLFGAADETAPAVVNFCRFLISLDNDADPTDGIFVPLLVRIMAVNIDVSVTFDMEVDAFESEFAELIVLLSQYRDAGPSELTLSTLVEYFFGITFDFFIDDDLDGYSEFEGDCDDDDPSVFPDMDGNCGAAPPVDELVQGDWTGETDQGEAISFRLDDGEVLSLLTTLNYEGDFSPDCVAGNLLFTESLRLPLVGDAFTFSTDRVMLTGVFTSPTTVEGTWFYQNEACDGEGNGMWTAETSPEAADRDGDGFTEAEGDIRVNGETADDDPTIYPGAPEICGDGVDQDLDGDDLICPDLTEEDVSGSLFLGMTLVNMPRKAEFESAHITIKGIQIRVKGGKDKDKKGWQFFGEPNQGLALLDLTGGNVATLAQALLQSGFDGKHNELRLFLAENDGDTLYNYVIDKDGVKHPLELDKRSKKDGVKVKHHFRIRKDQPTSLLLEMDVHKSIKKKKHGWELKPHFKVKECKDCVFVEAIEADEAEGAEGVDVKRRSLDDLGGII